MNNFTMFYVSQALHENISIPAPPLCIRTAILVIFLFCIRTVARPGVCDRVLYKNCALRFWFCLILQIRTVAAFDSYSWVIPDRQARLWAGFPLLRTVLVFCIRTVARLGHPTRVLYKNCGGRIMETGTVLIHRGG